MDHLAWRERQYARGREKQAQAVFIKAMRDLTQLAKTLGGFENLRAAIDVLESNKVA